MTHTQMIAELSELTWLSKYRLRKVYLEFTDLITSSLQAWDTISIAWIGKLVTVDTKARECINPQTMDKISIKANKRVKFKVSSRLKKVIRI